VFEVAECDFKCRLHCSALQQTAGSGAVSRDNDKPLAVLLKYEHFMAMQERIRDEE